MSVSITTYGGVGVIGGNKILLEVEGILRKKYAMSCLVRSKDA